jgi:thiamine kinase-like enzyme
MIHFFHHNIKQLFSAVFFVDAGVKKVLLRVYGVGCDQILDRAKELEWLARLSQLHIGPKLLGTFGNGRFEEYLESRTLTYQDIRDPNYSTVIASRLAQLHSLVHTFPKRPQDKIEIWTMVDKWYGLLAGGLAAQLAEKSPKWAQQLKEWDLVKLGHDIEKCKNVLEKVNSPLVFAHNDVSLCIICSFYVN